MIVISLSSIVAYLIVGAFIGAVVLESESIDMAEPPLLLSVVAINDGPSVSIGEGAMAG